MKCYSQNIWLLSLWRHSDRARRTRCLISGMLGSKAAEKGDIIDRCLLTALGCCEDSIGSTTSGLAVAGQVQTAMTGGGDSYVEKRIRFLSNSHGDGCGRVELSWILWGAWGNARGPESVKNGSGRSLTHSRHLSVFIIVTIILWSPLVIRCDSVSVTSPPFFILNRPFSNMEYWWLSCMVSLLPFPLPRLASSSFITVTTFSTGFSVFFTRLRLGDHGYAWGMGVFRRHGG